MSHFHGDYWLRENAGASQPGEDPEDACDEEAPDWIADAQEEDICCRASLKLRLSRI